MITLNSSLRSLQTFWKSHVIGHNTNITTQPSCYLISNTPQGVNSFVSKRWGSRVFDRHITENSSFPGSSVCFLVYNFPSSSGIIASQNSFSACWSFSSMKSLLIQFTPCDVYQIVNTPQNHSMLFLSQPFTCLPDGHAYI